MWGYLILAVIWLFNWFSHRVMAPGGNLGGDSPNYPQIVPPAKLGGLTVTGQYLAEGGEAILIRTPNATPWAILVRRDDLGITFDSRVFNLGGTLAVNNAAAGQDGIFHNGTRMISTTVGLTNNAAANTATLTNAPVAGNPSKWVPINDNGVIRNIPAW